MGNRRRRDLGRGVKEAVAKAAGQGQLGRSGRQVMLIMHRLRKTRESGEAPADTGNRFVRDRVGHYFLALQQSMQASEVPMYSLSSDATRLSGKDMLHSALWSAGTGQAAWCPPP
eukprot:10938708-Lingulodinium_polyedra.AAC.2